MVRWLLLVLTLCSVLAESQDSLPRMRSDWPAYEQVKRPAGSVADPTTTVSSTDTQIAKLQDRVRHAPGDYAGYDQLGAAFFQKARESGDITYYDLAEQALKTSLDLAPRDFRAADPWVHISLVYMGEHRFTDVIASTQKAIAFGSGNLAAFAVEGDAYTDMGEYEKASDAYNTAQKLGAATASPLGLSYTLDSRQAYLTFLHGDSSRAIQLMNRAVEAGLQTNVPRENLAWLYFELGERYFQTGDFANAERAYGSGIAADPNHYRSLAGLAKVRAAQARFDESIVLYQRSIAIIPFPVYVAELGDVYQKLGRMEEAQQQYDLVEYIAHLSKLNQVLANRELALFYADHEIKLAEAMELARNELAVRRDIYTWDTLAWVLYKNGRFEEAAVAIKKALILKTNDSLLLFHAGMIDHSLGKESEAEQLLSKALQTNPHFHVFYADLARQTLGDISRSLSPVFPEHDLRSDNARH
jgi:tetratricopeptide (TPR) repeat protein